MKGMTVILITHRFSAPLRMPIRSWCSSYGTVIEQGSHCELMQLNSKYAELYNMQAKRYLENEAE